MNISSEISIHGFNSSVHFSSNGTQVEMYLEIVSVVYIICILFGFPLNSYVIWLIVRGTGNGLAAEFFILNLSVYGIILCVDNLFLYLAYKFEILWIVVGFVDGLVIGRPVFQCLMCVERYLAVVHPVIFLKFKPLRYRLMCSAVVWLATLASAGCDTVIWMFAYEFYLSYLIALFSPIPPIQLFCCVAVLRVLKQSGPGERGREREEENHMRRRAFYLILISNVTTFVIYMPYTILLCLPSTKNNDVYLTVVQFWYVLAGLVEPALFLYRVGKLNFTRFQSFFFYFLPSSCN